MAERDLAKVEVAGSIPVPRSIEQLVLFDIVKPIEEQLVLFSLKRRTQDTNRSSLIIGKFKRKGGQARYISGNCRNCGVYRKSLERDHIHPKWKALRDGWSLQQIESDSNIQYLCSNCHKDKTQLDMKGKRCSFKGQARSLETRERIRLSRIGYKWSEEKKQKISRSLRGRKLSDQHRMKISQGASKRPERHPDWGIRPTKSGQKWQVRIKTGDKEKFLGHFDTIEEAREVRDRADQARKEAYESASRP